MPQIEEVEMFKLHGKVFKTREAAVDYAEELVGALIKQDMFDKGFTVTDWVKVVDIIINRRAALLFHLDY